MRHFPLTYVKVFKKKLFWGKLFRKEKKWIFFVIFCFKIFKILKTRDSSFVALLILRHFI